MDVDGELWHLADLHSNVIRRAPRGLIIMFVWPFSWSTQAASLFWKPQQEHKQETACRLYVLRCRRPERRWEFQKCPSKLLHLCPLSSAAAATGHWNKEKCPPPPPPLAAAGVRSASSESEVDGGEDVKGVSLNCLFSAAVCGFPVMTQTGPNCHNIPVQLLISKPGKKVSRSSQASRLPDTDRNNQLGLNAAEQLQEVVRFPDPTTRGHLSYLSYS